LQNRQVKNDITFSDSGVHSAEKKMEKRFKRQEKEEIKIKDMSIKFEKKY
jgi:hypothetical protein